MSFCFLYSVFCTECCEFYVREFCSCWWEETQVINKTQKKVVFCTGAGKLQLCGGAGQKIELCPGWHRRWVVRIIDTSATYLGRGDFKKQFSNRSQISGKFTPLATANCGLQRVEECSYPTLLFQQNPSVKGQSHKIFFCRFLPNYRRLKFYWRFKDIGVNPIPVTYWSRVWRNVSQSVAGF